MLCPINLSSLSEVHGLGANSLRIEIQLWHSLVTWPWTAHAYHLSIVYKMR